MSMSPREITTSLTVIGIPTANELTDNGIITALQLEDLVWMGLTYGAWFKLALFVSLIIVILLNLKKMWVEVISPFIQFIKSFTKGKGA